MQRAALGGVSREEWTPLSRALAQRLTGVPQGGHRAPTAVAPSSRAATSIAVSRVGSLPPSGGLFSSSSSGSALPPLKGGVQFVIASCVIAVIGSVIALTCGSVSERDCFLGA